MKELLDELRAIVARPLMTPAECAEFLSVSEEHLYEMRRDRRGPPFLAISPKVVRYDREDVLAWARSHSVTPQE